MVNLTARALRFQSNIPIQYWGECLLTAAYLINKIPTPLLSNRSPHETLIGTVPNYQNLKVFGCLCYAKNNFISNKFDSRAEPGIFIGYPFHHEGYKILDLFTKKIYISRHVKFYEHIFPYNNALSPQPYFLQTPHHPTSSYYDDSPEEQSTEHCITTNTSYDTSHLLSSPNPSPHVSPDSNSSGSPISNNSLDVHSPAPRPTRCHRAPRWMEDYHCSLNTCTTSSPSPLTTFMPFKKFSSQHQKALVSIISATEPRTFHEAIKYPHWKDAMVNEIKALELHKT
ncbi:uncharacterized protein LOC141674666 [Apium graveolens]|uniref:uncharacterized protein LOC141674666 n=1 Tax=Apium graveolens TaxID=4045 RepID=UPI003D7A505C